MFLSELELERQKDLLRVYRATVILDGLILEKKGLLQRTEVVSKRKLEEIQEPGDIFEYVLLLEEQRKSIDLIMKEATSNESNEEKSTIEAFEELVQRAVDYAFEANALKNPLDDGISTMECSVIRALLLTAESYGAAVVASGILLAVSPSDMKAHCNALENAFGTEVANLVRDVLKISKLSEISRDEELENPELMPDLILAMVVDARAVMIKISEHLVQMTALDMINPEKKQRLMNETLHVHIPLAERLGLNLWKNQLENLCVSASNELKKSYASFSKNDLDDIAFEDKLRRALEEKGLTNFRVESRKKSLHSILKKMDKYCLEDETSLSKIKDIIGLRIIVETEEECYKAEDVVKKLWKEENTKDYIKNPKPDGYKSLHVIVKNKNQQSMEVQIRTQEMHKASDDAHWVYKEGNNVPEYIKELVKFARLVIRKKTEVTGVEGNSSPHQPGCSYAMLNKPPCLDATVYMFPSNRPSYVIVKADNKATIEECSTGTLLRTLYEHRGLKGQSKGRVLVNKGHEGLDYTLKAGDIIEFVCI